MKAALAAFLTQHFGLEVAVTAKGFEFVVPQSAVTRAALSNIVEAFKHYRYLRVMQEGGKRFVLLTRATFDSEWEKVQGQAGFDICNDAIITAAGLSKNVANGELLVYDAQSNRDMLIFPAGGF